MSNNAPLPPLPLGSPTPLLRHKRSKSDSVIRSYATSISPEWFSPSKQKHGGCRDATTRARSASFSMLNKGRATPERPPRPLFRLFESPHFNTDAIANPNSPPTSEVLPQAVDQPTHQQTRIQSRTRSRNSSNASSVQAAPPQRVNETPEPVTDSTSPVPPAVHLLRAASNGSTTAITQPPERKLSAASSSSIPCVIGIPSPHNPTLIAPTAITAPTACSITRYAPLKIVPPTARGTMASTTSVTSPVDPSAAFTTPRSRFSLSRRQDEEPRTPSHSRSVSGSSVCTAIRMPRYERDGGAVSVGDGEFV